VRYLNRATRIYGLLTLGIFLFGLLLAHGKFNQVWLTASMTLFIVAFVLLLLIERDQRKALHKIELAAAERGAAERGAAAPAAAPAETPPAPTVAADKPVAGTEIKADTGDAPKAETPAPEPKPAPAPADPELAKVETGRIAMISGVVALIWIVILVLMVWNG
jgi:Ca2+/Na+ antiporter